MLFDNLSPDIQHQIFKFHSIQIKKNDSLKTYFPIHFYSVYILYIHFYRLVLNKLFLTRFLSETCFVTSVANFLSALSLLIQYVNSFYKSMNSAKLQNYQKHLNMNVNQVYGKIWDFLSNRNMIRQGRVLKVVFYMRLGAKLSSSQLLKLL